MELFARRHLNVGGRAPGPLAIRPEPALQVFGERQIDDAGRRLARHPREVLERLEEFPLDLDLASPMMAGTILRSKGEPRTLLPEGTKLVVPGPRYEAGKLPRERGAAPASLQYVMTFLPDRLGVDAALERLTDYRPGREARAVTGLSAWLP